MQRILYITTREIYPITGGREVVLYNYCKGLYEKYNCEIDLFCFGSSEASSKEQEQLEFVNKAFHANRPNKINKFTNLIGKSILLKSWPMQVSLYYSKDTLLDLKNLIKQNNYDTVICDMARTAEYLRNIDGIHRVLDMNDLISNRYYRQCSSINKDSNILGQFSTKLPNILVKMISNKYVSKLVLNTEADLLRKYEVALAKDFDDVIFVSYLEAKQYDELIGEKKSITVPIGVDYEYYSKKVVSKADRPTIVFLGNMFISHNRDAVDNFIDNIWTDVEAAIPNIVFKIVGKCDVSYKKKMSRYSNIEITGIVDDIREHVQDGWIGVAPLTYGSGVKTKVLETMAMGLPVVTNSIGAEGIDADENNGLFIYDDNREMINGIIKFLGNEELLRISSESAEELIKSKYTWDRVLSNFEKILNEEKI